MKRLLISLPVAAPLMAFTATASAAPVIYTPPVISGTAQVGQAPTLTTFTASTRRRSARYRLRELPRTH